MANAALTPTAWHALLDTIVAPRLGTVPLALKQAIKHIAWAPSKLLRPRLVYALANDLQSEHPAFDYLAVALELLHCYTLLHDDLPCMDNAHTRRGRPACHHVFGEANAILAGDGLQLLAVEVLSSAYDVGLSAHKVVELTKMFAQAGGINGVVGGQVQDLAPPDIPTPAEIIKLYQAKTARLFELAAQGVALIAGCSEPDGQALTRACQAWGVAFQIHDDLGDQLADSNTGSPNYANYFGYAAARSALADCLQQADESLGGLAGGFATTQEIWGQLINMEV